MCEPATIAMVTVQMAGAAMKANAAMQSAKANAAILERNAVLADTSAADAVARGAQQEGRVRLAAGQNRGQQIAAAAAGGVGFDGSTGDMLASSAGNAELDAQIVKNNAAREAWGFREKGSQFRYQADVTQAEGRSAALGSLLGGIAGAAKMSAPLLQVGSHSLDPYTGPGPYAPPPAPEEG